VKEGLFAFCLIFLFAALVPATLFCAQRSGSSKSTLALRIYDENLYPD